MEKYYAQRYRYFSKFDEGIIIEDDESWFSVTPEKIAKHIAERCACGTIVDAFCGVGGNSIQFAMTCEHVIAIDIRQDYLEQAWNNARVYGVEDKIEFIHGDFFEIVKYWQENGLDEHVDAIFLSPPWGGPEYINVDSYHLTSIEPVDGFQLIEFCKSITNNLIFYIPRNTDISEILSLKSDENEVLEIEQNYLNGKLKTLVVYFGEFVRDEHFIVDKRL